MVNQASKSTKMHIDMRLSSEGRIFSSHMKDSPPYFGIKFSSLILLSLSLLHLANLANGQLEAVGAVLSVVPVTSILATAGLVGVKLAALSRLLQVLGYDQAYLANAGGTGTAAQPIGLQPHYSYMFPYVPGLNISIRDDHGPYQGGKLGGHGPAKTYPAMGLPGDYELQRNPFRGSETLKDIFRNSGLSIQIPTQGQTYQQQQKQQQQQIKGSDLGGQVGSKPLPIGPIPVIMDDKNKQQQLTTVAVQTNPIDFFGSPQNSVPHNEPNRIDSSITNTNNNLEFNSNVNTNTNVNSNTNNQQPSAAIIAPILTPNGGSNRESNPISTHSNPPDSNEPKIQMETSNDPQLSSSQFPNRRPERLDHSPDQKSEDQNNKQNNNNNNNNSNRQVSSTTMTRSGHPLYNYNFLRSILSTRSPMRLLPAHEIPQHEIFAQASRNTPAFQVKHDPFPTGPLIKIHESRRPMANVQRPPASQSNPHSSASLESSANSPNPFATDSPPSNTDHDSDEFDLVTGGRRRKRSSGPNGTQVNFVNNQIQALESSDLGKKLIMASKKTSGLETGPQTKETKTNGDPGVYGMPAMNIQQLRKRRSLRLARLSH